MNIIQEMGRDYFNQRCAGGIFLSPEGITNYVVEANTTSVVCKQISGDVGKLKTESRTYPHDHFTSFNLFRVPELGWRSAMDGRIIVRYTRNNTRYERAVCQRNLITEVHPLMATLIDQQAVSPTYYQQQGVQAKMIAEPGYIPMVEGLERMRSGELLAFAVTPHVAVAAESDDRAIIYFGSTPAGTADLSGDVTINSKYVRNLLSEAA